MDDLIVVKQLPIIEEQLQTLKARWEQMALDAEAMVCTEETIQAVKAFRADMRKEFDEVEAKRKQVKSAIMDPYNQFEAVYKDCATTAFKRADEACAQKVSEVETDMKRRCENGLRSYFAELCAVRHLDWLEYERAGIKVDMASAKAKTPTKLRKQLADFVTQVGDSVDRIIELDGSEEIMVEFKRSLDAANAICKVHERNQRIEEERAEKEGRKAVLEQEAEAVHRLEKAVRWEEPLPPPVGAKPEKTFFMDFRARGTLEQLRALKQFAQANGIKLEEIKHE